MALPIACLFIVSLGYGVIVPLLPELAGGRAATDEGALAMVFAAYSAAKILFQVPGGVLADRLGAPTLLRWGMLGFTLSLAGFLVGESLAWFTLVRTVEGAATGVVYPAVFSLVARHAEPHRMGRSMGTAGGIGTSGMLVGPALAGLMAPLGARMPVLVALGCATVCTLWCIALPDRAKACPAVPADAPRDLRVLAKSGYFLALLLPVGFNKLTYSAFQGILPLYGTDAFSLSVQGITGLFVLTGVGFGICQPLGGLLADKLGPLRLVSVLIPVQLVSLGLMGVASGLSWFVVLYGVYVATASVIFTAIFKHAAHTMGTPATQGRLFGMMGTITDVMVVVGPLVFLNLYGAIAEQTFMSMASVGMIFFAAFAWKCWQSERPRLLSEGSHG